MLQFESKNPTYKAPIQIQSLSEIVDQYDLFLVDINGIVYDGVMPFLSAIKSLNFVQKSKQVIFLSNTPRPGSLSQRKLLKLGVQEPCHVFTSGDAVRIELKTKYAHKKVFHLGGRRNTDILADLDIMQTNDLKSADVILMTQFIEDDENIDQFDDELKAIAHMNLPVICANPDKVAMHGTRIRYCAGTFAQRLNDFGGTVQYYGKPGRLIYDLLFQTHSLDHIPRNRILMIGDTLETDVAGGQEFGIDTLLVMTGNTASDIKRVALSPEVYFKNFAQDRAITPNYYSSNLS